MTSENMCVRNRKSKYSWDKWICGGYCCYSKEDTQRECANFRESYFLKGTCAYEEVRSEFHGCKCPDAVLDRMIDEKMEEI